MRCFIFYFSIEVSPGDPRFVGAWWLGFLACGTLLVIVALLLMCYPKDWPDLSSILIIHDVHKYAKWHSRDAGFKTLRCKSANSSFNSSITSVCRGVSNDRFIIAHVSVFSVVCLRYDKQRLNKAFFYSFMYNAPNSI